MDCVFCAHPAVERGVGPVADFIPLNPVTPGHRLFVPRRHLEDATTDPLETARVMAVASQWAGEYYESFNLITSVGANATQSVFHLHIHLVPRWPNDGLHLPWTGQARLS